MIYLFLTIPISIADSGHKSLTSKTSGIFLQKETIMPVIPINNGGEDTNTRSYFPLVLKTPAKILEKTKEK